jgi:hypothetical protein
MTLLENCDLPDYNLCAAGGCLHTLKSPKEITIRRASYIARSTGAKIHVGPRGGGFIMVRAWSKSPNTPRSPRIPQDHPDYPRPGSRRISTPRSSLRPPQNQVAVESPPQDRSDHPKTRYQPNKLAQNRSDHPKTRYQPNKPAQDRSDLPKNRYQPNAIAQDHSEHPKNRYQSSAIAQDHSGRSKSALNSIN